MCRWLSAGSGGRSSSRRRPTRSSASSTCQYTAEPGFYGSMTTTGDNCFGVLLRIGNLYQCGIGPLGFYQPNGYVYTDPYGRVYTMGTDGSLQTLKDLNGNMLTVTANGISSTNGLNVPFVRDASGRITRITDTLGNHYTYAYDASGNLSSFTLPGIATSAMYQYDTTHLLTASIDPAGNSTS